MKWIESIKLKYRAFKYKNKNDKGGISYLISAITKGQTVFDIGAHKAGYLYFMQKQVGEYGKVFAFEPQSCLFNYIKKLKALLNWQNVTIEHLALSDTAVKTILFIPAKKGTNASSPGATIIADKNRADFGLKEEVNTETLDAYCIRNNVQPDFLKIDVEGNELKIFQGGLAIITKFKPKIYVEIEARHIGREQATKTFDYLQNIGYKGYFLHGTSHIPMSDFSFEKYQNTKDMKNYCNNFIFE